MSKISVSRDDEVHRKVDITLKDPDKEVMFTRGAKTYRDILLYISESGVAHEYFTVNNRKSVIVQCIALLMML